MKRFSRLSFVPIKKQIGIAALFFVFLLPIGFVSAYVLPGIHVLDLTSKALGKAGTLRLKQKIIRFETWPDQRAAVLDEIVYLVLPDRIRSDIVSNTGSQTRIIDGSRFITVIDGKRSDFTRDVYGSYRRVLTYGSRTQLLKSLSLMDIDVSKSSLGRFNDNIAFVLGANYPDMSRSQFWIEKDSFIPLKLVLVEKPVDEFSAADTVEIVFGHWSKKGSILYPMQIHFYRNGLKEMEIMTENVLVDPVVSMELMSIEHLESTLVDISPEETIDETDREAVTEVQQTIDDFKKKFE